MARFRPLLAVALGGALGSLTRWGLVELGSSERVEVVTLGINVVGSLLLGVVLGQRERLRPDVALGLGTGFAGGLTTFSGYAVHVAADLEAGTLADAATIGVATPVLSLVAAGLGYRLARRATVARSRRRARSAAR